MDSLQFATLWTDVGTIAAIWMVDIGIAAIWTSDGRIASICTYAQLTAELLPSGILIRTSCLNAQYGCCTCSYEVIFNRPGVAGAVL